MLSSETVAELPNFLAETEAQWSRFSGAIPGLQCIRSGDSGSQVMLVYSTDDLYEGVVIAQLPHVVMQRSGSPRNPVLRPAPESKKPHDKRAIAMSDEEVAQVIEAWRSGRSALDLPHVSHVYDRSGRLVQR